MSKPFKTIDEQIELLRYRGMTIADDEVARHALETLVQYLTRTMGLGGGTALPSVLAAFPATDVVPLRATGTPDNWQSLPLWTCEPTT